MVSDRGEIPQSLALAKIDNVKKLHETLHILLAEWKKLGYVRQRRKFNRHASSKTASVVSGMYLPIEAGLSDTSCLILPKINYRANAT